MNISSKNKHTQFTWTAGKRIIYFLLRNKTHSWRASYNRGSPMDLKCFWTRGATCVVAKLFPSSTLRTTFCTNIFSHRLCSLVMQFSALHDSHRATHSIFFLYSTPGKKKRQSMQHGNTLATCHWGLYSELVQAFYSQLFPFIHT